MEVCVICSLSSGVEKCGGEKGGALGCILEDGWGVLGQNVYCFCLFCSLFLVILFI